MSNNEVVDAFEQSDSEAYFGKFTVVNFELLNLDQRLLDEQELEQEELEQEEINNELAHIQSLEQDDEE